MKEKAPLRDGTQRGALSCGYYYNTFFRRKVNASPQAAYLFKFLLVFSGYKIIRRTFRGRVNPSSAFSSSISSPNSSLYMVLYLASSSLLIIMSKNYGAGEAIRYKMGETDGISNLSA